MVRARRLLVVAAVVLSTAQPLFAQVNVLTQRYDNGRTGANLRETTLTVGNVNASEFGLLFSLGPVDGNVYAQPLYVSGLTIGGVTRNVVFIATEHNSVYAFDADGTASAPLWHINLGPSVPQDPDFDPVNTAIPGCHNLTPEVGITSTPVIDLAAATIYVVAKTKDATGIHQHLHALSLTDGVLLRSVQIEGSVTSDGWVVAFDPALHLNRPGLLLSGGVVYLGFGSLCDYGPYHGWLFGYDAATFSTTAVWAVTPTGEEGAIWQSGVGLTADAAGNIYTITSNGTFRADGTNLADSVVKLTPAPGGLVVADFFTPKNQDVMEVNDWDLGSSGAVLLPGTNRLIADGKEGRLYLIDRDNMGRFDSGADHVLQSFQTTDVAFFNNVHGAPVPWQSPDGMRVYLWGENEPLKAFAFDGTQFDTTPVGRSTVSAPPNAMPGGFLTVSANGNAPGTGIVWASIARDADATNAIVPGVLRAFDAEHVDRELWNSDLNPRDTVGPFAKFNPPTVANGKVYLATFSGVVQVYGLTSTPPPPPGDVPPPWQHQDVGPVGVGGSASFANGIFTVRGAGSNIWGYEDSFHFVDRPVNGDVTIVARVTSLENTNAVAKAGVMLRASTAADAAHVVLDVLPNGDVELMTRPSAGEPTTFVSGAHQPAPAWLRLVRTGATVTASVSADGTTWTTLGTTTLSIGSNALAGLVVCSVAPQTLNTATFDTVSVTTSTPPPPPSDLPAPWQQQDVGTVGVSGSASFGNGVFTVRGEGSNIWGYADSFHFVDRTIDGDVTIVARVTSLQNTDAVAKAGVMLRASTAADAAHVILNVRPTGDVEFMTRPSTGQPTTFVAGAYQPAPAWLRLVRTGTTVTGEVSADGATWTTVGTTTLSIGSNALAGLVVCSVAAQTLNTATFDNVTVTTGSTPPPPPPSDLPAPWQQQDVGSVDVSGSALLSNGVFTARGSGSNVWGYADGFHFVDQPVAGDVTIVARVTSLQNTDAVAKAGVMLRASTAADAAHVILNVRPTGDIEFMTRPSTGQPTTFVAGAYQPAPAWLRLVRTGTTVTGEVSADGATWTTVGTTTLSIGSNALAGLVVCSVAAQTLNTATFDNVSVTTGSAPPPPPPSDLPAPWQQQDVGSVNVPGSAGLTNGVFTVRGSGSDVWGYADGYHFVDQPVDGDVTIVARVTGVQNTNAVAKGGVMLRESTAANAAHVILDVRPTGDIEFMTRPSAGQPTTFVAGAYQSTPVWLRLVRTGTTVTGEVSADGATWMTVGTTTLGTGSNVLAGLVVCSVEPQTLNTATFDSVSVTSSAPPPPFDQILLSAGAHLSAAPGPATDDYTIAPR